MTRLLLLTVCSALVAMTSAEMIQFFIPNIQCNSLSHQDFCTGPEFPYTDGCNYMWCEGQAKGTSSRKLCRPELPQDKADCDKVRSQAAAALERASDPKRYNWN